MSNSRRIVLFDRSLPPEAIKAEDGTIFVSTDSFYQAELIACGKTDIRYILDYAKLHFNTYDDLYFHYKDRIDSELRPSTNALLFELYSFEILSVFAHLYYMQDLLAEIMSAESIEFIEAHTTNPHLNLLLRSKEA